MAYSFSTDSTDSNYGGFGPFPPEIWYHIIECGPYGNMHKISSCNRALRNVTYDIFISHCYMSLICLRHVKSDGTWLGGEEAEYLFRRLEGDTVFFQINPEEKEILPNLYSDCRWPEGPKRPPKSKTQVYFDPSWTIRFMPRKEDMECLDIRNGRFSAVGLQVNILGDGWASFNVRDCAGKILWTLRLLEDFADDFWAAGGWLIPYEAMRAYDDIKVVVRPDENEAVPPHHPISRDGFEWRFLKEEWDLGPAFLALEVLKYAHRWSYSTPLALHLEATQDQKSHHFAKLENKIRMRCLMMQGSSNEREKHHAEWYYRRIAEQAALYMAGLAEFGLIDPNPQGYRLVDRILVLGLMNHIHWSLEDAKMKEAPAS